MVIDLKKNIVYVYFHMNEGEINPKIKVESKFKKKIFKGISSGKYAWVCKIE